MNLDFEIVTTDQPGCLTLMLLLTKLGLKTNIITNGFHSWIATPDGHAGRSSHPKKDRA